MDRDELNEDIKIDPTQLDVEAARQADLFLKWAERSVELRDAMDRAEAKRDRIEARLQLHCRRSPAAFNLESITEKSINSAVLLSTKYTEANEGYLAARLEYNRNKEAVVAMEQKKGMLELLIKLHGQEYFAGPAVPRDLVSAWQEHRTRAAASLAERQGKVVRTRVSRKEQE